MVAVGILPVTLHNGELLFLFGKENDLERSAKGFSCFGGKQEPGESLLDTAAREGAEELSGFLGDSVVLKRLLREQHGRHPVVFRTDQGYHTFLLYIPYDETLVTCYNQHHRFLWHKLDKQWLSRTKCFEKSELRWFPVSDLVPRKQRVFRPFYRTVVNMLLANKDTIESFVRHHARAQLVGG